MEKFETGTTTVAAEVVQKEGVYTPEQIAETLAEAEALIAEGPIHPTPEKVAKLKELLNILGVTKEGSDEALYNEHRFIVEKIATLLVIEEAQLELEAVISAHPNVFSSPREAETA